mmetsp:Transcript_11727/g.16436  ORF Transcript_11727/g.16436 Transcript_11727/m.16436 type:complete len:170 (+) Transcript_11727:367-876(+)
MTLTEEQKEQIRKNREKALELQKKRKQALKEEKEQQTILNGDNKNKNHTKKQKIATETQGIDKQRSTEQEDYEEELEDWEIDASLYVSKKEAQSMYCLPEGTLAVCTFVEKENPRNKGFAPMKLYERKDIRQRAHRRFGGVDGLQKERKQREENRFRKDLERTKDIFRK